MAPIELNVSLFAHIELDSDASGRYGVQGNVFKNTFGYLHQYLQTLDEQPPQIKKIVDAMASLIAHEEAIEHTNNLVSPKFSVVA